MTGEIVGCLTNALLLPFVAFEGWEGLAVVRNVGGGSARALASPDEGVL